MDNKKIVEERVSDEELQKLIESGAIGTMTECAYGKAIADDESDDIKKKKKN